MVGLALNPPWVFRQYTHVAVHCVLWTLCLLAKHGTAEETQIFSVDEGLPAGSPVGKIDSECSPPVYEIFPHRAEDEDDISVDRYTGEISTKKVLDREVKAQYQFLAISQNPCEGTEGQLSITIIITDINDHAPMFPEAVKQLSLSESTPRDAKYALGSATDPDLGINSTQRYEIVSGNTNSTFRLGVKRSPNGILYLDLEINGRLDYEMTPAYNLVIRAYDGQGKYGQMRVHVIISDANDNQPIFNQTRYSARVSENATVGTPVAHVYATDLDSGDNGLIEYYIDRQRSDPEEKFDINPSTGMIYVNKDLDYETKSNYELIVVARDHGALRSQTTAIVSVVVLDVNDNEPTINLIFLTNDGTAKISETAEPGEYVARISVSDPDLTGSNYAHVNVTLDGGDGHFGLTTRDNVVYLVILTRPLDRELKPFYRMTVVATDSGTPPLRAQKSIQIVVTDANDNPPVFARDTYYADIQEVVPVGASVIVVTASDRDEGDNALLTYSIVDSPRTHSDWFHIDNRTGLITTRKRLDCETASEPRLTVVARDAGVRPLSASAIVIIRIQDVNDNQPVFDQSFYNVSVPEDRGVGSCILKVAASDPDCGGSSQLVYQVASSRGFGHPRDLEVRERTGEVCVVRTLDFETRRSYEFSILAKDQDDLEATTIVKVTLRDVNDNRPRFEPAQYNVNLAQTTRPPASVVVVRATDADTGTFGRLSYSIVSGNELNIFRIDSTTGDVELAAPLPSSPRVYQLGIRARDGGGLTSSINANVSVSVLSERQRPPQFSEQLYRMSVREDASIGSTVGTVRATNANPDAGAITYSLVSGDPGGYFSLDPVTGQLITRRTLDYAAVSSAILNIQAASGSPPSYGSAQVRISVTDVNNNAPEFEVSSVELLVKESTPADTVVYMAAASDRDGGENGRISYSLEQGDQYFRINARTGAIALRRSLDYEGQKLHTLRVVARDNGASTSRRATMTVTVQVQDVNDNSPVFRQPRYSATIVETIAPNTRFLQVNATDKDSGNNARITYLLKNGPHIDKFGVQADGYLYNRVPLDREDRDEYTLHVVAMDSGIPPRSASAEVRISVLDANDNSPVFQEEMYIFHVEENRPAGTLVGAVSASDRDQTDSLSLEYLLSGANDVFTIKKDSGHIFTKGPLDHEGQNDYMLSVQVTDGGSPPLTASVNVRILVLDVNDNSPTFDHQGAYRATVDENQPKGTVVTQVSAHDLDKGENGTVTYHFADTTAGEDAAIFTIHATTGRIKTREVLDHETRREYTFKVIARDGGSPPLETSKTVIVTVNDINESPPLFTRKEITFKIKENTPPGRVVGNVKANDTDSGENGRVVYFLVEGNLFGTFKLNETTGSILISKPVDYEVSSSYTLIIRAVDNSVNPMSSSIVVHIEVLDENDNAPVFEQDPLLILVREDTAVGSAVHTFRALDKDSGARGTVHYTIVSQSPDTAVWFNIDLVTGVLRVNQPLDYEQLQQVSVQVQATDQPGAGGGKPLSSSVTALVRVQDVNDNPPVFQTRAQLDLLEDEPVGFPIEHVFATDADSRENGRVSYALVSGNERGHFRIDQTTGLLSIARSLDREDVQLFRLNVTARDHGHPQQSSFIMVRIHVIDVNDNPPAFRKRVYNATVVENGSPRTFVTNIQATDPDTGKNAQLKYLIPHGIADNRFVIGASSGDIETNGTLDRETRSDWVITAYVKDSAFPALYDTTTVLVTVTDVNDNAPVFKQTHYSLEVPENAQETVIHTVVAMDADAGENGRVTYSIVDGNEDRRFELNPVTGELFCLPLDRERSSTYRLTLRAADAGTPPRTGQATLTVRVLDENDNNPVFERAHYEAMIAENVTIGTEVVAVTAEDADEGANARILYSISNATEGLFVINNSTGVIITAGEFDREKKDLYTFEVDATDGGQYGPRSRKVRVSVRITDVNDNAPVFTQIPYKASLSTSAAVGQYVVSVSATDKDEGANGQVLYSLVNPSAYFEISADQGVIVTKAPLGQDAVDIHTLEVKAQDRGSRPQTARGVVEISVGSAQGLSTLRFSKSSYTVQLDENAPTDTPVASVSARFVGGGSGDITYSFASGNEDFTFNIDTNTGSITVNDPRRLDFETTPRLRLIVVATSEAAYGYSTVWVDLRDVNDNPPRFTQERYVSSVFEGNRDGTYVTQVSAADADSGANGRVTYAIIGGNIQNAFVIEPANTGIVKTNFILDREIHASYRLEIEAVDGGVPPRTSRCTLKIAVNDINDNAPFFPSYPPRSLPEGQELGTEVLQVTANDKDLDPVLHYGFTADGNPGGAFSIDRYSGRITLVRRLDYERRSQYLLRIKAADGTYNATTSVTINIIDQNDHAPEFSQADYQVELPELTPAGHPVLTVNATDRDSGDNARLTYTIFTQHAFSIDAATGTIYTNKTVVFNQGERIIQLVVKAADHGNPSLSQAVPVRLQVIDINNNAPVFERQSYSAEIREDAPSAMTLLTVAATDDDFSQDNSKVDYSIISGNEHGTFRMTHMGQLVLLGQLDYEQLTSYELLVMAKDRGKPPLNSTARVTINVVDVNDNEPVFGRPNYTVRVNESVEVGTVVVRVSATDSDTGDNAQIRYFITSGNDAGLFIIQRQSGVITLGASLNYEVASTHRLVVRAEDSSLNFDRRSSLTSVVVKVSDVNEFNPHFPVMMYLESVREKKPINTMVFTAHANDQDGGEFGIVRYSIRDSYNRFRIDPSTGVVTTTTVFNYSAPGQRDNYRFDVIATDKAGKYDTVPVSVNVLPEVEALPQFTHRTYQFTVPGNATVGYEVGEVRAVNHHDSRAGRINYFFKETNEYFAIDKSSGLIVVTKDLQEQSVVARRRRAVESTDHVGRSKRALEEDLVELTVVASSSLPSLQGKTVEAKVALTVDRTCAGCQMAAVGQGDASGTVLVIVVVLVIVAVIVAVVLIIIYLRNRDRKRRPPENVYDSSYDTSEAFPPTIGRDMPPTYNEIEHFPSTRHHARPDHNITTSEISEQSHSASSGRGSAEDGDDVDEEIRMINETPLQSQAVRMPDSGIQQDDDTVSEHSVHTHQEYLARLGIDSTKLNTKAPPPGLRHGPLPHVTAAPRKGVPTSGSSVESMHHFSDEGGGEGVGLDLPSLVYSKLTEVASEENMAIMDGTRRFRHAETATEPSHAGSLSSVINSEEEFSGSYNWDYLLDWGPQYQPLAHVFAEIARLKDDSIKPKKQPTHIVPQRPNITALNSQAAGKTGGPPPLLTNAPPMAVPVQPTSSGSSSSAASSAVTGSSSAGGVHSSRTSQMTSLPSLPRSPISHESSYTSPALSPSFTPSLSPLATRSPSISPLVTPQARTGSAHNTPQRQRPTHITLASTGSSESEQEIRI